ncbi:hypothetical protein GCM10011321_00560 [Youhaiella tibetensis]|nr:hypothetical protein GCM10011321_00560 [Youhaiella tibetensis]
MIMKEKGSTRAQGRVRYGQVDDGLGPNTDIGARLRSLYGAVQDEGIPTKLLDLLEQLDQAETRQKKIPQGE